MKKQGNESQGWIAMTSIWLLWIMVFSTAAFGQSAYTNGVKNGIVKVKFNSELTIDLPEAKSAGRFSTLEIGDTSFDAVSKKHASKSIKRLFPAHPNPEIEARHKKHGLHLWYVLEVSDETDPSVVARSYGQLANVDIAEIERKKVLAPFEVKLHNGMSPFSTQAMPYDDPLLVDQWHYNNDGSLTNSITRSDVNLFDAWNISTGSSDVIVAIMDMGVDVNHVDIAANMWVNEAELNGQDGVDDDNNGYVDDIHGWNYDNNSGKIDPQYHGTHVAGTVSAVNNNGVGVSGVAGGTGSGDGAKIMSTQFLESGDAESMFVYAADNGAVISQNSWGYTSPGVADQSIRDAINYFIDEAGNYADSPMRGGIVIFAAGNNGLDADFYPGYYEEVLTVGALGPDYAKSGYSNYGTWVDIMAPGGNSSLGSKAGVLSTLPDDSYGYLDGTSMACPHVSGIAALVLSNADHQYTPGELRAHLVTSGINIDEYNPNYVGLIGDGLIDAASALATDNKQAPEAISDLTLLDVSQEFAIVEWTSTTDPDDGQAREFQIYVHTSAITEVTIEDAIEFTQTINGNIGDKIQFEIDGLFGLTNYHVVVTTSDRWGNASDFSNALDFSTNAGPAIAVDANSESISLNIDVSANSTAQHDITIHNNDEGLLRWSFEARHKDLVLASPQSILNYPSPVKTKSAGDNIKIGTKATRPLTEKLNEFSVSAFEENKKYYTENYGVIVIGETDLEIPNSAATKFIVNESEGFNMTDVYMILQHDASIGPIILEVYAGEEPLQSNLVFAQEYSATETSAHEAAIKLDEQLFFAQGESFWIVMHVPPGNQYPLGIAAELSEEYSDYCFLSNDLGNSWMSLESAVGTSYYAWTTMVVSKNAAFGEFLTLDPSSGEVIGLDQITTSLAADASSLINGNYSSNIVLKSNDINNKELRIPVSLTVSGQVPKLASTSIVDFGGVFQGTSLEKIINVENTGLGALNNITTTSSNPDFTITQSPGTIGALDDYGLIIKYTPSTSGSASSSIILAGDESSYNISVFGIGTVPPVIDVTPSEQTVGAIALGDEVTAQLTVSNTGEFPLKYYVPGWDDQGISDELSDDAHQYGYKVSSNETSQDVTYVWEDISTTGNDITQFFKDIVFSQPGPGFHYTIPLEFSMPFYSHSFDTIYVTSQGTLDFENSVRLVNSARLDFQYGPDGLISPMSQFFEWGVGGNVYYQSSDEKLIVQYEAAQESWYEGPYFTFQVVIHRNGDINFYYKDIMTLFQKAEIEGWIVNPNWWIYPIIEDPEKLDGIQLCGYNNKTGLFLPEIEWRDEMAFQFEYPGPDIITNMVNGSGTLLPGENAIVDVTMSTEALYEGTIKRSVNFISNDPINGSKVGTILLEITSGGAPSISVNKTEIDFGQYFQGDLATQTFIVKNTGTAALDISLALANDMYLIAGNSVATIEPQRQIKYVVELPTDVSGIFDDVLTITHTNGTDEVVLTGEIMDPPAIEVDESPLSLILPFGDSYALPISVSSTGQADLEFSAWGTEWLNIQFEEDNANSQYLPEFTYKWKSSKDEDAGFVYNWKEIKESGTRIDVDQMDSFDSAKAYYPLKLPFQFEFYGDKYDSIYVGYNGILTFTKGQIAAPFALNLPYVWEPGPVNFIAPMWMSGGFDTYTFGEKSGIFYEFKENYIIITHSWVTNVFSMGGMMSFQTLLYKDGTIKFQYKKEEQFGEVTSQWSTVGIVNKDTTDVIQISGLQNLGISDEGLAIVVNPAKSYRVAPGTTLNGTATFDASNIYNGSYESAIHYQTIVPGSKEIERTAKLTVIGEAALESSQTNLEFGELVAYNTGEGMNIYSKEFVIRNTGSVSVSIQDLTMANPSEEFEFEIYTFYDWQWTWRAFSWFYEFQSIQPGEEMKFRLNFTPNGQQTGVIDNTVIVSTVLPDVNIPLNGNVILPPVVNAPSASVDVIFTTKAEREARSIQIGNETGSSDLIYSLSIEYIREEVPEESANKASLIMSNAASIASIVGPQSQYQVNDVQVEFNRTISYEQQETQDNFIGYNGTGKLDAGTQFNAGVDGFNLTHIQSYFRTESLSTATIAVEIIAGNDPNTGVSLLQFDYEHAGTGTDEEGAWVTIPLDNPIVMLPNEDFIVVLSFPFEINYPQGITTSAEIVEGRHWLINQGAWVDFQGFDGFETAGWMIRAAEETFASSEWVTITSEAEGTIVSGQINDVSVDFIAQNATRGDQYANLLVTSNDPVNPEIRVPLSLYLNEGPQFLEPLEELTMMEGDTLLLDILVTDKDGDLITMANDGHEHVSYTWKGSVVNIKIIPGYESEGMQVYGFTATDSHGTATELALSIEVKNTNRAPKAYPIEGLEIRLDEGFLSFDFHDYLFDPDGDALSFSIVTEDSTVLEVFKSDNGFVIKPNNVGGTNLVISASDWFGDATEILLPVNIGEILAVDLEDGSIETGVSCYPNPVKDQMKIAFGKDWDGTVNATIYTVYGAVIKEIPILSSQSGISTHTLNLSDLPKGLYILELSSSQQSATVRIVKD